MLPSLVVLVPLAVLVSAITTVLYLGPFSEEPFELLEDMGSDTNRTLIFWTVLLIAVQGLFSGVASSATVVSIAAASRGTSSGLRGALDVAFTRMGAVLGLAIVQSALVFVTTASLVGILALPFLARLSLAPQVLLLEQRPLTGALGGSWKLTASRVTRVLGTVVLSGLLMLVPILLFYFAGELIRGSRDQQVWLAALVGVIRAILLVPVIGVLTAAVTIFYIRAKEIDGARTPA